MANLNVNKVIYGGDVLIDLTGDSVSADKILKGITAHDKSGAKITGTCTFDSDTSEDTAAVAEILVGKTAHAVIFLLISLPTLKRWNAKWRNRTS